MKKLLIAALSMALPFGATAQSNNCLAINFAGDVYRLNVTTGTGTLLGNSGLTGTNCLCRSNDKWIAIDNNAGLYHISPATGAATFVLQLDLGGNTDVRGICNDVNLTKYVVVNNAISDQLWKVNSASGVGTLIGDMGSTTIQGLAVGFNGKLYAYDVSTTNSGGLREVDPLTGATVDLDPTRPGQPGIQDICPNGTVGLLGARDSLFGLSATNGFETLVGSGGFSDIRGLARRQSPFEFDAMSVKLGRLDSGNIVSIQRRDGDTALISKFFVPNQQVDPINVEVTFGTEVNPVELAAVMTNVMCRMNTSGSFTLSQEVFNNVTNQFQFLSQSSVSTVMSQYLGGLNGDLTPFFNANKRMIFRFRVKAVGPVSSPSWGIVIDMVRAEYVAV